MIRVMCLLGAHSITCQMQHRQGPLQLQLQLQH